MILLIYNFLTPEIRYFQDFSAYFTACFLSRFSDIAFLFTILENMLYKSD